MSDNQNAGFGKFVPGFDFLQSLAKGVSDHVGGGPVKQTVVEWRSQFLIVTVAGERACLAVLCAQGADIGLVAYEMAMLLARVGQYLTSGTRAGAER